MMTECCVYLNMDGWYAFIPMDKYPALEQNVRLGPFEFRSEAENNLNSMKEWLDESRVPAKHA